MTATARSWRVDLPIPPATIRTLSLNSRGHWRQRHRATSEAVTMVRLLTRNVPLLTTCTVQLHVAFGDRRRRDADNIVGLAKPIYDGLLPHVVPDDTPEYMTKPTPIIVPPPTPRGVWIVITEGTT